MARVEPRSSPARAQQARVAQQANAATIAAASGAAAASAQVTAAIEGDLIAASPSLAAAIDTINTRLDDLEAL